MTPADLETIRRAAPSPVDPAVSGMCSVCNIRKRLTREGNVKLHSRHDVRCTGSLAPPRPVKVRPPIENWARTRREVLARDGSCRKCGAIDDLQAHHRKERVHGGADVAENLVTLCGDCHAEWTYAEPPPEFLTFEAWLAVPPARFLVHVWIQAWPDDKSAADFKREIVSVCRALGRYPHP